MKMDKLVVRGTEINVQWDLKRDDFLSLTDIAKIKDSDNPRYIIQNWLRNRNTIEFLGVWEMNELRFSNIFVEKRSSSYLQSLDLSRLFSFAVQMYVQ